MGILHHIGRYFSFMASALRLPQKGRVFRKATVIELEAIGVQSVGIVVLLSLFMGAVIAIQTAHQVGGWIPAYTIGFTVRQTMILEFAPTIIPVILSGKVGSNIASQIGTCAGALSVGRKKPTLSVNSQRCAGVSGAPSSKTRLYSPVVLYNVGGAPPPPQKNSS